MESTILVPLAIVSGFANCYAAPTTATVTTLVLPVRSETPFPEDVPGLPPHPDHGPHGDGEPGATLIPTNGWAASGSVTNTSAAMMTSNSRTWVLPTSEPTRDRDAEFTKLFLRTGASVMLSMRASDEKVGA